MTPETVFSLANPLALVGWLILAVAPLIPRAAQITVAWGLQILFAVLYSALMLTHWTQAQGGYGSLADVMALLSHPGMATAGWIHFLAFDLFVGAWIVRDAARIGVHHLAVLPCLALTFLFGPVGLLIYITLRGAKALFFTPNQEVLHGSH